MTWKESVALKRGTLVNGEASLMTNQQCEHWLYTETDKAEMGCPYCEIERLRKRLDAAEEAIRFFAKPDEPEAPQWDINSIERIARQQGVFGGRDGNTVTITGPIRIDGPSVNRSEK